MNKLRFDKTDIKMLEAAVVLATSTWPWAGFVHCSPYDWPRNSAFDIVMKILTDEASASVGIPITMQDMNRAHHNIIVRPSNEVPPGWVVL